MNAKQLYEKLDSNFELDLCQDDWSSMEFNDFISENFKNRHMGILLDNSEVINKIYTSVFPSNDVLNKILNTGESNLLLFVHHPMIWDIRKTPVFSNIDKEILPKLKERGISIYAMHVPLDKNGEYSTTICLAKALDIVFEGEFYLYHGVKVGVYGKTNFNTPEELADKLSIVVGHKSKLWKYGSDKIKNHKVALIAGGANEIDVIKEIIELGINTFVTGVTALNDYSRKAHEFNQKNKINLIGGSHYSTEKFACIAMCDYFKNLGLDCKFLESFPILEDME